MYILIYKKLHLAFEEIDALGEKTAKNLTNYLKSI